MGIKQFNASYLLHDDRLLFRFNTDENTEFRFWFTRRVTLFILAATQHLIVKNLEESHSPEVAKAIAEFGNHEPKITVPDGANNIQAQYQQGNSFPLGAEFLLVVDVRCSFEKEASEDLLSLDLVLPAGANLNLKMSGPILQAMCILLNQLRQQACWGSVPLILGEGEHPNSEVGNKELMH